MKSTVIYLPDHRVDLGVRHVHQVRCLPVQTNQSIKSWRYCFRLRLVINTSTCDRPVVVYTEQIRYFTLSPGCPLGPAAPCGPGKPCYHKIPSHLSIFIKNQRWISTLIKNSNLLSSGILVMFNTYGLTSASSDALRPGFTYRALQKHIYAKNIGDHFNSKMGALPNYHRKSKDLVLVIWFCL